MFYIWNISNWKLYWNPEWALDCIIVHLPPDDQTPEMLDEDLKQYFNMESSVKSKDKVITNPECHQHRQLSLHPFLVQAYSDKAVQQQKIK